CRYYSARLSIYRFFFHASAALLDLHSFPTRRSSDLRNGRPDARRSAESRLREPPGEPAPPQAPRPSRRESDARSSRGPRASREEDRKSTRLNSSHVSISYAVFCLKKKKKTKYTHTSK